MRLKHFLMLIALALVSPIGLDSDAHAQSVVRLGEARIALTSGRATINLSGGSPVDRIQLESTDHAVQVISAKMTFADGRVTSLGSLTLERASRSGELAVGTPGVPRRVELIFKRQSGARTRIVVFGHVVAAGPAAPTTSDAPGVARKAYRASKGARPVETPQAGEADAARERDAAEQSERLRQEAARRQAEERLPPGAGATDRGASTRARRQA